MRHMSESVVIAAPAERTFAYVDDIRHLAAHMSETSSMAMMGSKLKLEIVSPRPTGLGATYRYSGKILGITIDFSETVTRYVAGREKAWRTIDVPRLLIMSGYEMGVRVEPLSPASSRLTITINYDLPASGVSRVLGLMLGKAYSRWCLTQMCEGAKTALEKAEQTAPLGAHA